MGNEVDTSCFCSSDMAKVCREIVNQKNDSQINNKLLLIALRIIYKIYWRNKIQEKVI